MENHIYRKGDIIVVNLKLNDQLRERVFLISDNHEAFEIVAGYNITSIGSKDSRKKQYITNVPLVPNHTNHLNSPSVVKMNNLYLLEEGKGGKIIGHLTPEEQQVVDTYQGIYEKTALLQHTDYSSMEKETLNQLKLYEAIKNKDAAEVRRLLDAGASPNATGTANAPLHFAAIYGADKCAEELLKKGACISALNSDERTPLELAIKADNVDTAAVLLRYGADPDISVKQENPQEKSAEMERLLNSHSDNINSQRKLAAHPQQEPQTGRRKR